ncbi:MAG: ATP-dependent DNA helicase [Saprospiraceae bacterium]|nr:ATP-dependent DNA helicase [Saprospiraceae bacterium]
MNAFRQIISKKNAHLPILPSISEIKKISIVLSTQPVHTQPSFNDVFAAQRATLNPSQLAAVRHIEGPTLVIAGPGTGKTHILATRIGEILTKTDAQAHNILCLTFTDAAVRAMRERLTALIGAEAHKVRIHTFHSFCNRVIQDNLDLFGRQDLTALDELERRQLVRALLDDLPFDHPLKKGRGSDVYFYENHLADVFKLMKTEAWTTPSVARAIDEWLADLPNNPDFQYKVNKKGLFSKGDLKTEEVENETERMNRLRSAAQLYMAYEGKKSLANRYDFDDMILWVIEAFERLPFLLRGYQEQILYFMVDEFQDTNGAQNQLLSQLVGFWEQPNVFIVGDDDQAIYEFQGARLKSLVDFYEAYRADVEVVVLKDNYRSSQHLLDGARDVIEHNNLRIVNSLSGLQLEKKLIAQGKSAALDNLPQIVEYPNRLQELADVVVQIEQLLDFKNSKDFKDSKDLIAEKTKDVAPTIAVIYARHRTAEAYIRLFEKRGIPYSVRRAINVLDEPLIQNLRTLLEYMSAENKLPFSGEYLLFKILNFSFLGLKQAEVLKFSMAFNSLVYPKNEEDTEEGYVAKKWRIELTKNRATRDFSKQLEAWIRAIGNEPLPNLVEQVINQSGLMAWILNGTERIKSTQIVNIFFSFVQRELEKKPRLSLAELLKTLDVMDANGIRLDLQNFWSRDTEGVVLTTAHAAKGLEFDHVFVVDAVESEWEQAKTASQNRFKLPPTLTFTAETDATEARRRLFYVAITRAKKYLTVSYAQSDDKGRSLGKSQFVSEILPKSAFRIEKVSDDILLKTQIAQLTEGTLLPKELFEENFVTEVLKDFNLSISALNAYLDCPLRFYFENILRIPSQPSPAFQYGEAVHYALRKLFGEMLRTKEKALPSVDEFIRIFDADFSRRKPLLDTAEYDRRLATGRQNLTQYYTQMVDKMSKNIVVEKSVFGHISDVPVRGVIDQIVFKEDNAAHVIDFKTGKPNFDKVRRPTEKNPIGGAYWRQLVFYKLLYENHRANIVRVNTGEISWVEPDARGSFKSKSLDFTAKDGDILRGVISDVWNKIQARQFDGCGKADCTWCNFVRNNFAPMSFRNEKNEELDDV